MKTKILQKILLFTLLAVLPGIKASAQDLESILKGVANAVGEKISEKVSEKTDTMNITGIWKYVKPDVKFDSDDLLSKAGSELAAAKAEEHLQNVLTKIGINESSVFTFNSDSTYTIQTSKRTLQGTYTINKETHEMVMTSRLKLHFTAQIGWSILKPNSLFIRFKADKLMSLVKHISGTIAQKSTNKSINLANSMLNKYDGLTLGLELKKRK